VRSWQTASRLPQFAAVCCSLLQFAADYGAGCGVTGDSRDNFFAFSRILRPHATPPTTMLQFAAERCLNNNSAISCSLMLS